jgi:chemotaxis protein methyltransferase CheR
VTILGTDINRDSLAQGQRGEFGNWAFRSASDNLQTSCFTRSDQIWTIKDEYRRGVLFQYHNLVQHPFPSLINGLSAFDLILCRNVMLYFDPAVVPRLLAQFYDCLVEGGWFGVGPTETNVSLFRAFETVNSTGAVMYRKGPRSPVTSAPSPLGDAVPVERSPATENVPPRGAVAARAGSETEVAATKRRAHALERCRLNHYPAASRPATLADVRAKLNRGQSEAAAACCRKLLAAERLNPLVHFYHALVAEHQGHHTESEAALRRTIYLDRNYVLAHYHLGLALQRKRDDQAAQRSFRNVLVLLHGRADAEMFPDADGLTVGPLRQLTTMQLEILNRT